MGILFLAGIFYSVTALSEVREKRQTKCPSGQFTCSDGSTCIDNIHICDGHNDCWGEIMNDDNDEKKTNVTSDETIDLCINRRCPKFTFQCAYGACIDKEKKCDGSPDCHDKSDEDEELCRQQVDVRYAHKGSNGTCKVFSSKNMIINCSLNGYSFNCSIPPGKNTKMIMRCKNGFHKQFHNRFSVESICLENGNWSPPPHDDCSDCGRRYRIGDIAPLISYAKIANYSEYPWHAALYEKEPTEPKYICGGSIIHPKAILTAAHCVYDDTTMRLAEKKYVIAVGKYNSSWHSRALLEERIEVKKVYVTGYFTGVGGLLDQDIAILELENVIQINKGVSPVCIDWGNNLNLTLDPKAFGTVVGWGDTEYNVTSELLRVTKLKFYDFHDCRKNVDKEFQSLITSDKICAGLQNETNVQSGDSGGGLTFNHTVENYIYGVVSHKDRQSNKLAVFTKVTKYLNWIKMVLDTIIEEDIKIHETRTL